MANLSNINNKFIVEDSGDVGIGVTSATTKLHIGGTAPGDSIIRQDSTVSGTNWEIGERAAGKWQIFEDDGDSIVATFMSTGNVGIGTDSPVGKLQVSLPAYTNEDTNSQQAIFGVDSGYGVRIGYNETDNKGYINVLKPGVAWGSLILQEDIGNVGIGTISPNAKLKIEGNSATNGLSIKSAGNGGTYPFMVTWSGGTEGDTFCIDDNLRVGIGTNSPTSLLQIKKATLPRITLTRTGILDWFIGNPSQGTSNTFSIGTNSGSNTEILNLSNTGNVGIGISFATAKLQIHNTNAGAAAVAAYLVNASTSLNTETRLAFAAHTNDDIATNRYSYISTINTSGSNGQDMIFATNATGAGGSERMRITSAGDVLIHGTYNPYSQANRGNITLNGSNSNIIAFTNNSSNKAYIYHNGLDFEITNGVAGVLKFATNSTERMRIDGSGRVGIGTSDIEETLTIAKTDGGDGTIVGLRSDSSFSQFELVTKNSQVDWGLQTIGARNMYFTTNGSERMRITSGGNVAIGGTLGADSQFRVELKPAATILAGFRVGYNATSNNYYDADTHHFRLGTGSSAGGNLYIGGGVYLGGTAAANNLDDYEEGTWTPTAYASSGAITGSYSEQLGTYTKIGRQIICMFDITVTLSGTMVGFAGISGLPFTVGSSAASGGSMAGYSVNQFRSSTLFQAGGTDTQIKGFVQQGASYIYCQLDNSGVNGFGSAGQAQWNIGSVGRCTGYVIYFTD